MNINKIIILYVSYLIVQYGLLVSFSLIENRKIILSKNKICFLSFLSIISFINNTYNLTSLKIVGALVLTYILEKIVFKINYKDTFINVIIITFISLVIELLLSPFLAIVITNIAHIKEYFILQIVFSFLNTLLLILLLKNKKIINLTYKLKIGIKKFTNYYTISLILICFINIILYFQSSNLKNLSLLIIALFSVILLLICLKIIINDKYNYKILLDKNKNLEDSYKAYANIIDECRELKHNLKNDLYTIKSTLNIAQQEKINKLFQKYNHDYEWITKIDTIPEGLQGIVYLKSAEAKKHNVKIIINSNENINISNKNYIDLCSSFSILLDNAIEASRKTSKKIIEINIYEKNKNKYITIINKFNNQININKIGKKNYSTKEYKSGIGLNYIHKIKNNKIDVKICIVHDLFITKIKFD